MVYNDKITRSWHFVLSVFYCPHFWNSIKVVKNIDLCRPYFQGCPNISYDSPVNRKYMTKSLNCLKCHPWPNSLGISIPDNKLTHIIKMEFHPYEIFMISQYALLTCDRAVWLLCSLFLFFIQPLNPNPDSNWGAFFKDNDMLLQIDKDCRWVDQGLLTIHGCNYTYIESWQAN